MDNYWEKIITNKEVKPNELLHVNKDIESNKKIENLICVLAGGLQENGDPHLFVINRLDKAIEVYNTSPDNTIILVLGGGTYHKPPYLNSSKFIIHESTSCTLYLYSKGIKSNTIFREWSSYDTIANGFFAFTNYINYLNLKKMHVITSDFHMPRSKIIFNFFNNLFNKNHKILYLETPSCLDITTTAIRNKREQESKINFIENIVNKIKTPDEFIYWFYTEHKAYASIINYIENNEINNSY